jgi:hypothetical protein
MVDGQINIFFYGENKIEKEFLCGVEDEINKKYFTVIGKVPDLWHEAVQAHDYKKLHTQKYKTSKKIRNIIDRKRNKYPGFHAIPGGLKKRIEKDYSTAFSTIYDQLVWILKN